ncbi:MAG: single-stranded-DNA-specific exonuclease RecJ [Methylococcaceae bacterium]
MLSNPVKKSIVARTNQPIPDALSQLNPLLAKIYLSRGIDHPDQLDRSLKKLPSPWLLLGMTEMVDHLIDAISNQANIMFVADFDADGATSCCTGISGLTLLGAKHVDFIVPNRFEYGYGLTPEIVELASQKNPDLIITVDNGISSLEGVRAAKSKGIKVLVTDHHLPGDQLPEADAIVNPNLPDDPFPCKSLAGVGVIFYVLLALRSKLRELQWFEKHNLTEPNLANLLDYVALGTVADVVQLDQINRVLVHQGILRIRSGKSHPGLNALITKSSRKIPAITATDLAFAVAPRLNAAGRMDDMSLGIRCLLTSDQLLADEMAEQLDDLNKDRRDIESQMGKEAMQLLQEMKSLDETHLPAGVCLYDKHWHQGVIGILASRIKDRLHRPVIAFAPSHDQEIKGSARSIAGVHIRDVLSEIAATQPDVLTKFGGHAMAAGLSLHLSNYPAFALAFDEVVTRWLAKIDLTQNVFTDGKLSETDLTINWAETVAASGPWGQGFPEPEFDGEFEVLQCRIVGQKHIKLVLREPDGSKVLDAIWFFVEQPETWMGMRRVRIVYQLDINEYRNQRNLQLIVRYLEKVGM